MKVLCSATQESTKGKTARISCNTTFRSVDVSNVRTSSTEPFAFPGMEDCLGSVGMVSVHLLFLTCLAGFQSTGARMWLPRLAEPTFSRFAMRY